MMRGVNTAVLILGAGLGIGAHASSDSGPGPYRAIVERNVFALKPPASAIPEPPPAPPPMKITLTGITTFLGNKRVLMNVAVPNNKPPENYMLTEGQSQGEIMVLEIDEKAGSVKVLNHGQEQTLNFKTDGAKALPPVAVATPGVIPGQPPRLPIPPPNQPPGTVTPQPPQPNPALRTIPTRSMRLPGTPPNPNADTPPQP